MHRVTGILASLLLLTILSVTVMAFYPVILKNASNLMEKAKKLNEIARSKDKNTYKSEFIENLYRGNYVLYWDILNQADPAGVFLPDLWNNQTQNYDVNNNQNYEEAEYDNCQDFIYSFNQILNDWRDSFYSDVIDNYGLEYYIINHKTGNLLTNATTTLNSITDNTKEAEYVRASYSFYSVFEYDEEGNLNIPLVYGLDDSDIIDYKALELNKNLFRDEFLEDTWIHYSNYLKPLADITIIYAAKSDNFYIPNGEATGNNSIWRENWAFQNGGFRYAYFISLGIVTLLAFVLPLKKSFALGEGMESKVPFEIGFIGAVIILDIVDELSSMAKDTVSGNFLGFSDYSILPGWMKKLSDYGVNYIVWMIVFFSWFIIVLSFRSVFQLGIKGYLKERTVTSKLIKGIKHFGKKMFAYLTNFDLKDNTNRFIIKILAVNFVILLLLCSIWYYGIAGLILYTVILYFIMKKYMDDLQRKHAVLLNATKDMAQGNLEVSIDEDLGIFNSLKEELTKIQYGFKRAVEEETKSQKMKTELITNVSHDLKTPLTAIITYINLLKEENITEEERKSYIETLDSKSMRLKKLIEDLFEISKATSHNITLNLVDVDLISLIKQVQLELSDKIKESNIEFRYQFQAENVILKLDSEKTYRIFENLFVNILKYAMPGTRAYIEIWTRDDEVTVTLKNVSAAEITFNPEEITERFVRGDESRNTEGSGLGLAIVKNFVELQGGKFYIQLDGDLFKAIIKWKKG
ncbi:MAG: histidine kinase [Lachnoclostridium sp.]